MKPSHYSASSQTMRWEKLQLSETEGPGKRWGHTCNAVKGGRFLYVFGGYGKDKCQTNEVHVFDTVTQMWSQPVISGIPPTPRDSHTCTNVGDHLFVFGGTDGMNPLKDLHILDTAQHAWRTPIIRGEGPGAREGHGAALVGKRLFIFGGCGKSYNGEEYYFNDLYILNTETFVWKCAQTTGAPPSPRDSHTCSSWKNKLIVIGGEDTKGDNYLSDVHILDTDTLAWKKLNTSGQQLPPRAGHTTISFGKNLFVFGGFTVAQKLYDDLYMLDLDSGTWTNVITTGSRPSARFSVAGDSLDPQKAGVLVFMGGCDIELEALSDIYYLHTGLLRETERKIETLSLRKQLKLKCQEQSFNPSHDKALIKMGTTSDIGHLVPVSTYAPPYRQNFPMDQNQPQPVQGQRHFSARLVERLSHGYVIEAVIDGKRLRGAVVSTMPNTFQGTKEILDGIRVTVNSDGINVTVDSSKRLKTSDTSERDVVNLEKADGVNGNEAMPPVGQTNIPTSSVSTDAAPKNAVDHQEGSTNPKQSAAPLSMDERSNSAPSLAETSKDNVHT